MRRSLVGAAATALALAAAALVTDGTGHRAEAARTPGQPNIVVIMVDDQPPLDGRLLSYEPVVRDQIAALGATFTDFHSESPLCCPARVGYWTGQHTHNHGVTGNVAALFDPSMSLATQLHGVGYHTLLAGKYLNGYSARHGPNLAPNVPPGWDDWAAMGSPAYYGYTMYYPNDKQHRFGHQASDYSTDVVARRAAAMIAASPPGQPLFAWIAPFSAHTPFTPAPRYASATCSAADQWWDPPNYNEADVRDKPGWVRRYHLLPSARGFALTELCRQMLGVNDLVSTVLQALADSGRLSDTILVYAGDNGMNEGEHRLTGKTAPYETQVPFYLRWPGVVAPGTTIGERVQNIDLAPTLCAIAGCTLGPYPNGQTVPDGISFLPLLSGASSLGRGAVLDELPAGHGAHSGRNTPPWEAVTTTGSSPLANVGCAAAATGGCRWHYIYYPKSREQELYDDSNGPCWSWVVGDPGDPCELQNQARNPALRDVRTALQAVEQQLSTERGGG